MNLPTVAKFLFARPNYTVLPILIVVLLLPCLAASSQKPMEVLPTRQQVQWANSEIGVIIHLDINIFAPNTFDYARRETLPDVDAFNPSQLNTDQWIKTAKAAGATYAVLTVKHGTGFCLWPSLINPYNVGHTRWRNGREDILREFIASCRRYGVKPGLYYNTNTNTYYDAGRKPFASDSLHKAYNKAVLGQLTELWSNYGPIFEIWFDGGVQNDKENGLETPVLQLLKSKQPHAILFQGPLRIPNIIRWIGNEDGVAAYPQWSKTNATTSADGTLVIKDLHGDPNGQYWCPGESDFPIRRNSAWNGGWLWHAGEDKDLFTVKELVDKYYKSVGRNTNMLIGMVVDTNGLIPKADSLVFDSLGKNVRLFFAHPVLQATNIHQANVELVAQTTEPVSQIVVMEDIAKGEHIRRFAVDAWIDQQWKEIVSGQSIGHKYIQQFPPVTAPRYRFRTIESEGEINISQITLY